jgi:hypothetical protein
VPTPSPPRDEVSLDEVERIAIQAQSPFDPKPSSNHADKLTARVVTGSFPW